MAAKSNRLWRRWAHVWRIGFYGALVAAVAVSLAREQAFQAEPSAMADPGSLDARALEQTSAAQIRERLIAPIQPEAGDPTAIVSPIKRAPPPAIPNDDATDITPNVRVSDTPEPVPNTAPSGSALQTLRTQKNAPALPPITAQEAAAYRTPGDAEADALPLPWRNPTRGPTARKSWTLASRVAAWQTSRQRNAPSLAQKTETGISGRAQIVNQTAPPPPPPQSAAAPRVPTRPGVRAIRALEPAAQTQSTPSLSVTIIPVKPVALARTAEQPQPPTPPATGNADQAPIVLAASPPQVPPLPSRRPQPRPSEAGTPDSVNKQTLPPSPPPPADTWTRTEIDAGLATCAKLLAKLDLKWEKLPPIKRGACGAPAPIRVSRIGSGPGVLITPAATLTCPYAAKLHQWVKTTLQPQAMAHLGAKVRKIRSMASYTCRNRYGGRKTKLSEHAKANAIDIGGFELSNGQSVSVLNDWGPTEDDIDQARIAAYAAMRARTQAAGANPAPATAPTSLAGKPLPVASKGPPLRPQPAGRSSVGAVAAPDGAPVLPKSSALSPAPSKRTFKRGRLRKKTAGDTTGKAKFLHAIHAKACGPFGTVLGPEANRAHRNHFHFDGIKRRSSAFCE